MQRILLCLDGDPQPSVFDAVVAVDAGVECLLRHGGVKPADVRNLVYGLMFTRGVEYLNHSAIFIGGSDATAVEALLKEAIGSFFGPQRTSVMLDGNGANTTAAAAVLAVRKHVPLAGSIVAVLGATGAVGRRVVRLLAREGARVRVGSRRRVHAEGTCDRVAALVPHAELTPIQTDTPSAAAEALAGAQAVIACGAPGVVLLDAQGFSAGGSLQAAVDLNAVPPLGIAGIESSDKAKVRHGAACYGALGVGGTKMKIHKRAIAKLFTANDLVLDAEEIYALGKELG